MFLKNDKSKASAVSVGRSAFGALFFVVFLDNLGFAIVVPYLFFYVIALGGSTLLYGVLLASYSLMSFISTPLVARFSDRVGRRKILLAALAISSISYFIFGSAHAIWLLFIGRMLSGTTAATVPVAQAYVADVTTPNQRLRYLGLLGAAAGIAFVLGPAIGGVLSHLFGYGIPSFLASALAFANLVVAYFRLPEPTSFNINRSVISFGALMHFLRTRKIALLFSIYFMFFVAFVFMQSALSPWLQKVLGFGSLQTGLIFFLVGGIVVFTQVVLLPLLNKKYNELRLTMYSILILAIALIALAEVQNLPSLLVVIAVFSFGFGIPYVTINTLISLNTPKNAQGGVLGIAWAIVGLAQTISPVLAASFFSFGVASNFNGLVFLVSAAISITILPLIFYFKKFQNKRTTTKNC
jgi:DHA1 family tetracycline resistance protein-like MFS transporter